MPTEATPGGNAKLAVCSYDNRVTGDCYTRDVADKAAVAHVRTRVSDSNNITGGDDGVAGKTAQGCIAAARGAENERTITDGRVFSADGVVRERSKTVGRVVVAGGVEYERINTVGGVAVAGGVVLERLTPYGRVRATGGVAKERMMTVSGVGVASGVAKKRERSIGRVAFAGSVVQGRPLHWLCCRCPCSIKAPPCQRPYFVSGVDVERCSADSGVVAALCVAKERIPTNCGVCNAGGEAKKGMVPSAVLNGSTLPPEAGVACTCGEAKASEHERDEKESKPRRRPAD